MKNRVQDELKQHFRPEFLNRIDDIIVFHQLSTDDIVKIVDIMLNRVDAQMKNKDMGLERTRSRTSCRRRSSTASCGRARSWWSTSSATRPATAPGSSSAVRPSRLRCR